VSRGTQPGPASPRWRQDLDVDHVWAQLVARAQPEHDGTLVVRVGSRELADALCCSRNAVEVRLRELRTAGRVTVCEVDTTGTLYALHAGSVSPLDALETQLRSGATIAEAARRLGWAYSTTQRRAQQLVRDGRWPD
jgi:biotin operon repressor